MNTINESITKSLATVAQFEHRAQLKAYAEQKRQRELRNALAFRVGDMMLECCPSVALMKVRCTKVENEAEFSRLREFLFQVAASEQYNMFSDDIARRAEASDV